MDLEVFVKDRLLEGEQEDSYAGTHQAVGECYWCHSMDFKTSEWLGWNWARIDSLFSAD